MIRASAWVMPAERWWIWADLSPLPGCPVPPVTNGKHLWDSWQGEGWRRGHDPSSPASAQIKGSLAFSSYQINLLAPMICIALNLPTAVKSVKHAGIGWHFSMQSLYYVYYTYSYSRAVGLFLCVCKDNFKKIIFQSSEILSGLYIWCLGRKKMEENGLTSHIWWQTAQEGTSESMERYTRLGNCRQHCSCFLGYKALVPTRFIRHHRSGECGRNHLPIPIHFFYHLLVYLCIYWLIYVGYRVYLCGPNHITGFFFRLPAHKKMTCRLTINFKTQPYLRLIPN